MECSEMCTMPARAAAPTSASASRPATLNEDPFNVRAEECALKDCQNGIDVQKELTETEMVVTSCGSLIQGTPDGGFIDSDGLLRLVQVVRVPLLEDMNADSVGDVLYDTVLAKIVKSQTWMRETRTLPHEFIIFCWLPPRGAYRECFRQSDSLLWTEALVWNVQNGGWPFSLRVKTPEHADLIFPVNFGLRNEHRTAKNYFKDLYHFLNPNDFQEFDDDEELLEWYLFDEEFQDQEETANEGLAACTDVGWWIALAIKFIQGQADAEEHLLRGSQEAFVATGGISLDMFARCAYSDAPEHYPEPRGKPALPHDKPASPRGEPASPPMIHGLTWWGLGCEHAVSREARPSLLRVGLPWVSAMQASLTRSILVSVAVQIRAAMI